MSGLETMPGPRRMRRVPQGRWLSGVSTGIAEHLDVDVRYVRIVWVLLGLTGAGVVGYLFLWVLVPQDLQASPPRRPAPQRPAGALSRPGTATGPGHARGSGGLGWVAFVVAPILLVLVGISVTRSVSVVGNRGWLLVPVLAVVAGAIIAWTQLDRVERAQWSHTGRGPLWLTLGRLLAGAVLAVVGVLVVATGEQGFQAMGEVSLAALAVLLGLAAIVSPWMLRLWQGMKREQAERVRATERADIAAHLHDSVLQTLALIQRTADNPQDVARLARSQERELRGWLYGAPQASVSSLAKAFKEAAEEVEDAHGIPVDVVTTGDRPLDDSGAALVRAAREALLNAVRHGMPPVSAFLEVGDHGVEAFVRDRGPGFDPSRVPEDRLGVRESIVGRMTRHGGTAVVRRMDPGTEVALRLPVQPLEGDPR